MGDMAKSDMNGHGDGSSESPAERARGSLPARSPSVRNLWQDA
jgi:hypothetical protein